MNGPDNATKRSSVSKKSVKSAAEKTKPRINSLSRSQSQTVKLIAPVMKPAQDLTLEQLLEMEPPSVQDELSQEEREKVAVDYTVICNRGSRTTVDNKVLCNQGSTMWLSTKEFLLATGLQNMTVDNTDHCKRGSRK
jgi:hypothetical protein